MQKAINTCVATAILAIFTVGCKMPHEEQVDTLFESFNGQETPGAAVIVIKDDNPIYVKAYGCANLEEKIPVTPKTIFRLA